MACNLASLNLMKFRRADGEPTPLCTPAKFITARSSFQRQLPDGKDRAQLGRYRPLGLSYANPGALLMAQGTAYEP